MNIIVLGDILDNEKYILQKTYSTRYELSLDKKE